MTLKADHSTLPRQQTAEGNPPDKNPRFVTALAQAWHAQYLADGRDERATANGSLLRGSDAATCGRQLSYEIRRRRGDIGMERSNPSTIADAYRFGLGSMVHDVFQEALIAAFPGAEIEVVGVFTDPDLSLHADAKIVHEGKTIAFELKTTNGFSFKRIATSGRQPAEGPKLSAILQGAMAAKAFNADELVVAYLSMELLSPTEAKRQGVDDIGRFACEYTYLPEVFLPLADAELARLAAIQKATDAGEDVPRFIPGVTPLGAEVQDPATGRWELRDPSNDYILNSGTAWPCQGYCPHALRCIEDKKAGL